MTFFVWAPAPARYIERNYLGTPQTPAKDFVLCTPDLLFQSTHILLSLLLMLCVLVRDMLLRLGKGGAVGRRSACGLQHVLARFRCRSVRHGLRGRTCCARTVPVLSW